MEEERHMFGTAPPKEGIPPIFNQPATPKNKKSGQNGIHPILSALSPRFRADSNRCRRFCRPLPSHSATKPFNKLSLEMQFQKRQIRHLHTRQSPPCENRPRKGPYFFGQVQN